MFTFMAVVKRSGCHSHVERTWKSPHYTSIYFLASSKELGSAGMRSCLPTSARLIEIKSPFDHFEADKKSRASACALMEAAPREAAEAERRGTLGIPNISARNAAGATGGRFPRTVFSLLNFHEWTFAALFCSYDLSSSLNRHKEPLYSCNL